MPRPSHYQEASSISQPSSSGQLDLQGSLIGTSIIILPFLVIIGAVLRRRYRASVLRKQVKTLEQLWQINLTRDDR